MEVLLIEDDASTRYLLETLLSRWGYQVRSAISAEAALQKLRGAAPPPLVVVDWCLPGMSGLDLIKHFRSVMYGRPPYQIIVSGYDRPEDVAQGLEGGADDYVIKPFSPGELRARINLGRQRIERERELLALIDSAAPDGEGNSG